MARERTLSIIKPDATARGLADEINQMFRDAGLTIIDSKEMHLSKEKAGEFYAVHKDRPFYDDLCTFMSSGPIVVQILEGDNAIARNREIMGATNPKDAAPDTIRGKYAESIDANAVHGSDAPETARQEITFFFGEEMAEPKAA